MAGFRFVISDKSKSYNIEKEKGECPIMGKKIGDSINGDFLGLPGFELQITGGSDKDGFPMRNDIEGVARKRFLITKGKGFAGWKKIRKKKVMIDGYKRKKTLRGNSIGSDISQLNCKVVKAPQPIESILKPKEETTEKKE